MTAAILSLMILSASPLQLEWQRIAAEYAVPPLSLVMDAPGVGIRGATTDLDPEGRATVYVDPSLDEATAQIVIAHESVHAMLRAEGIPYMGIQEERLANNFAYCWVGEMFYAPDIPCDQIGKALPSRWAN